MSTADGHVRLCAGCGRNWYLPWVPDSAVTDPPPWWCPRCRARRAEVASR